MQAFFKSPLGIVALTVVALMLYNRFGGGMKCAG
jgi:hypothetical protein